MCHYLRVGVVVLLVVRPAHAQELIGASDALQAIRALQSKDAKSEPVDDSPFGRSLASFEESLPTLSEEAAAVAWLAVFDDWRNTRSEYDSVDLAWSQLIQALPEPKTWPVLSQRIKEKGLPQDRTEQIAARCLRLLASRLVGNDEELFAELDAIDRLLRRDEETPPDGVIERVTELLSSSERTKNTYMRAMLNALRSEASEGDPVKQFLLKLDGERLHGPTDVHIPDLVRHEGVDNATKLLLRAMKTPRVQLHFDSQHTATLQLARRLALAHVDALETLPWELCLTTDTAELFEALLTRFLGQWQERVEESGYGRDYYPHAAASYYFLGMVIRGEDQAARRLFLEQAVEGEDLFAQWQYSQAGRAEQQRIYRFLRALADDHPDLNVWHELISVGTRLKRMNDVRQLLEEVVERADLDEETRRYLRTRRAEVALAAGDVDAAIDMYRAQLGPSGGQNDGQPDEDELFTAGAVAERLLTVGHLLDRPAFVDEGLKLAEQTLLVAANQEMVETSEVFDAYWNEMVRRRSWRRLEELLIKTIGAVDPSNSYSANAHGLRLADLYLRSERFDDVVVLLDEATWWDHDDLDEAASGWSSSEELSPAWMAARAFVETGRSALARQILERMLMFDASQDRAWELLLQVAGDDFPKLADSMFQRNRFEERPLIWLAQYQLQQRQLEAAEDTIRWAIAIDPSDGEQGAGDRLRAYRVLADILTAQGKKGKADVYRGAVAAIRKAEHADALRLAGLTAHAIDTYQASLQEFADAYCIQSRLAMTLSSQGEFEQAATHYERAFELMPDSFGRVESHCLGCEGVFQGGTASSIAQRVFDTLLKERPDDAKLHYLTGQLHEAQGRLLAAVESYQRAVDLDPDYLNAWRRIEQLSSDLSLPRVVYDEAVLRIYQLAPMQDAFKLSAVYDLKELWRVAEQIWKETPRHTMGPIYPLRAAADHRRQIGTDVFVESEDEDNGPLTPNEVMDQNQSIQFIGQILESADL